MPEDKGRESNMELRDQLDKHEVVTFKLLERDLKGMDILKDAEKRVGADLEKKRQDKLLQRTEFAHQIEAFNQKEMLKALQKKEAMRSN